MAQNSQDIKTVCKYVKKQENERIYSEAEDVYRNPISDYLVRLRGFYIYNMIIF